MSDEVIANRSRHEVVFEEDEAAAKNSAAQAAVIKNYAELIPQDELKWNPLEKRKYIANYAKFLNYEDHLEIGNIFSEEKKKDLLKENNDGCRVDLDNIKDEKIINRIFACVRHKIGQRGK